jgi:hypothetical protein
MDMSPHRFDFSHSLALELTPQSGPKIAPILMVGINRLHSQSIGAAQLSAKLLGANPNRSIYEAQLRVA